MHGGPGRVRLAPGQISLARGRLVGQAVEPGGETRQ
jgi:hypothetical protein